ncbi:MAG: RDD family protein [Gammaproteobacteria bacterium]|nr:RDD family protein [Gammaproteobacteria bacterium]
MSGKEVETEDTEAPGLLRRLACMLYDGLLAGGLIFCGMILVVIVLGTFQGLESIDTAGLRRNPFYIGFLLLIPTLFFIGFWRFAGETLGMRAWRLRIIRADGGKPTLAEATIRYFAALLSWAALGLGFLWILVDLEHRAWHDRLSGTRLVLTKKK